MHSKLLAFAFIASWAAAVPIESGHDLSVRKPALSSTDNGVSISRVDADKRKWGAAGIGSAIGLATSIYTGLRKNGYLGVNKEALEFPETDGSEAVEVQNELLGKQLLGL